jgi:putative DNA primase/helicase
MTEEITTIEGAQERIETLARAGVSRLERVSIIKEWDLDGAMVDALDFNDKLIIVEPPKRKPKPAPDEVTRLTDTANGELIAELFGDVVRYDHKRNRWLIWNKHYWRPDSTGDIYRKATEAARERLRRSADIQNASEKTEVALWAIQSENRSRLEAAVWAARNMHPIADDGEHWDDDLMLLGSLNGVVDLKTGNIRNGKPEDRITMNTGIAFDKDAKAPRFRLFVDEISSGDKQLSRWLQKVAGYSLTGSTIEQSAYFGVGPGRNGKGKFCEGIRAAIRDYYYDAPFSTFEMRYLASIPNDLAALEHKRFVTSSETNKGTRLNEKRLKAISHGDPVTARFLHGEFFTFKPMAHIWLFVNHNPVVNDDSDGFWRGVSLIPLTQVFMGEKEDKKLGEKLLAEREGILAWLIEGCLMYQEEGLEPRPACVSMATEEYRTESNPLSGFYSDKCVENPQATVGGKPFYKAYVDFCKEAGIKDRDVMGNTAFGSTVGERFKKKHTASGVVYLGVGLKSDGFVGTNDGLKANSSLIPHTEQLTRENIKNPSQPVNPSSDTTGGIGMSLEDAIELWEVDGRPPVRLPDGVSSDFAKMLRAGFLASYLPAVRQYLAEAQERRDAKE